jgi:hypothetical protein
MLLLAVHSTKEYIECFIEDQVFLQLFDSSPMPSPEAERHLAGGERAWSSINYSIHSAAQIRYKF